MLVTGGAIVLVGGGTAAYLTFGTAEDPPGSNGVASKTPRRVVSEAKRQAHRASSVHLHGTVRSGGSDWQLNMRLGRRGGTGEVSVNERTFALLRVGEKLYLKANEDLYRDGGAHAKKHGTSTPSPSASTKPSAGPSASASASAARALRGKYLKVRSDDPLYERLIGFTEKKTMLRGLFALHGGLAKGETKSVAGHNTLTVAANGGTGGSLQVAVDGKAYPLQYRRARGAGLLNLSEYGRRVSLHTPPGDKVIDYRKYLGSSKHDAK